VSKVRYLRGSRRRSWLWLPKAVARTIASLLLTLLDVLVPKHPGRVLLSSDKALKFNGNPRYLFEYLASQPNQDPYWLSASSEVSGAIGARYPGRVLNPWSWRALRLGLTAEWMGFSHSRYDLGYFAYLRRRRFIYLNHGVPLKTMGFAKAYRDPATRNAARSMAAISCCSEYEAGLWATAFRLPLQSMWVTGSPRNDRLFADDPTRHHLLGTSKHQKIILYAPTYRESGVLPSYLPVPDLDPSDLLRLLEAHDAVLLIRPHYYEWQAAKAMVEDIGSSRIRLADESRVPEVNELLPIVDVLITDYSSIYFDFLLLDRPIIFSCFDRDDYERERGFMIDYEANTPGAKVRTAGELLAELNGLLLGHDAHRQSRAMMRRKFHCFADGRSAERVAARMALSRQRPRAQPVVEPLARPVES
jgi:CDP-glycerol glycerophosphotransferase (TagB/SpsB family)